MKAFMRKHPLAVALVCLVAGFAVLRIPVPNILWKAALQLAVAAVMMGVMVLMSGKRSLARVAEGAGSTLHRCSYLLILSLVIGVLAIWELLMAGSYTKEGLAGRELQSLILCLSIGLVEESMCRGVLLSGFLRKIGGWTRRGVAAAVVLSSLIFGFLHVVDYALGGSYDASGIVQALLKTLQSGMVGLLFAAVYMRDQNLWAVALVHALSDFLLMQGTIFMGTPASGYVSSGALGTAKIIGYVVSLLLYTPLLVTAVKLIKEQELPEYGVFKT